MSKGYGPGMLSSSALCRWNSRTSLKWTCAARMTLPDPATPDAISDQSDQQHRHRQRYDRSSLCAPLHSPCRLQSAGNRQTSADLSCRTDPSFGMSSVLSSCSCSRMSSLHTVSTNEPAEHRLDLTQAMLIRQSLSRH